MPRRGEGPLLLNLPLPEPVVESVVEAAVEDCRRYRFSPFFRLLETSPTHVTPRLTIDSPTTGDLLAVPHSRSSPQWSERKQGNAAPILGVQPTFLLPITPVHIGVPSTGLPSSSLAVPSAIGASVTQVLPWSATGKASAVLHCHVAAVSIEGKELCPRCTCTVHAILVPLSTCCYCLAAACWSLLQCSPTVCPLTVMPLRI